MKEKQIGFSDLSTWLKILVIYGSISLFAAVFWITIFIVGILMAI